MAERMIGDVREFDFKEYGPEDAGQKIGWSTVVPTGAERDSFYLLGAYATVGPDGAVVQALEDVTNGNRLWHTGMTRGLSRACHYAVLLIPGEDVRIRNADYIRCGDNESDADYVAGHSPHFKRSIDDERVVWAKGEQEIVDTLKDNLDREGLLDEYEYVYLWINGAAGQQYPNDEIYASPDRIAQAQIFDATMDVAAKSEYKKAKEFELYLNDRLLKTKVAYNELRRQAYSAGDYLKLREVAHRAREAMNEIATQMVAPKLVYYAPERHLAVDSKFLDQPNEGLVSLYLQDMYRIQSGDNESIADSLESEARYLEQHWKFTERGTAALFALTSLGREYINQ